MSKERKIIEAARADNQHAQSTFDAAYSAVVTALDALMDARRPFVACFDDHDQQAFDILSEVIKVGLKAQQDFGNLSCAVQQVRLGLAERPRPRLRNRYPS